MSRAPSANANEEPAVHQQQLHSDVVDLTEQHRDDKQSTQPGMQATLLCMFTSVFAHQPGHPAAAAAAASAAAAAAGVAMCSVACMCARELCT